VADAGVSARLHAPVIEQRTQVKRFRKKTGSGVRALKAEGAGRKPSGRNPSRFFAFFFGDAKKKGRAEARNNAIYPPKP